MSLAAVIDGDARWHIEQAHVLDGLRQIPDDCVSCVVTSIPYWGLRSYGTEPQVWGGLPDPVCRTEGHDFQLAARTLLRSGGPGKQYTNVGSNLVQSVDGCCARCGAWCGELGAEPTIALYVAHVVEIFREVRRVLHPTGTCWLNVGDSYAGSGKGPSDSLNKGNPHSHEAAAQNGNPSLNSFRGNGHSRNNGSAPAPDGLKPKDLCLIPERLAIALQDDGWWVRSPIAWCKTSAMPESVTDRPTSAWEYIWLLAKSNRYYYDAFAVRTAGKGAWQTQTPSGLQNGPGGHDRVPVGRYEKRYGDGTTPSGANLRNFWIIGPEPFSEWEQTVRYERVASDAHGDGIERRASPDCPVHGSADHLDSNARGDEHADGKSRHTERTDGRLALAPLFDSAPTDQIHDADSLEQSSGLPLPSYGQTASGRSNQSHRTARGPATNPAYTASAEKVSRIDGTSVSPSTVDSAARISESNISGDSSQDDWERDPSARSESHNEGTDTSQTCTCTYYRRYTEKVSHFATFPSEIPRRCILAGSSEKGVCPECGAPWRRDDVLGWAPTCTHGHAPIPSLVLDPFMGSGTTAIVATGLGRRAIGLELSPQYVRMARRRVQNAVDFDAPLAIRDAPDLGPLFAETPSGETP